MDLTELLLSLFLAAGVTPWAFFQGACPCCGAGTTTCTGCQGGSGNTPNQVQVVISGLTNDTCSDCTAWNGTFILDYQSETPLGSCNWYFAGTFCGASPAGQGLYLTATASNIAGQLQDNATFKSVQWNNAVAGTQDCLAWSSYSVAFVGVSFAPCSGTPTYLVTALP